ncbi:hypothetical protein F0562_020748 [Nyssa sinensis]|uniref:Thioredoxin domain-containing protein n=1 Tax=Nyssa sinensis TaxID=561372 RepID=A0A5J5BWV0_9ASTE|nr:hypothetical protein F0562_020748 [Nyssa sinensis]
MKQMAEKRSRWIALGHGECSEIPTEKEFFTVVKASERVVCHFYRDNWPCKVMDKHMMHEYFGKALRIVVLPTVALINNAKVDDYVVGFDELGRTDEFSTEELDERLAKAQVIVLEGEPSINPSKSNAQTRRSIRQSTNSNSNKHEKEPVHRKLLWIR